MKSQGMIQLRYQVHLNSIFFMKNISFIYVETHKITNK